MTTFGRGDLVYVFGLSREYQRPQTRMLSGIITKKVHKADFQVTRCEPGRRGFTIKGIHPSDMMLNDGSKESMDAAGEELKRRIKLWEEEDPKRAREWRLQEEAISRSSREVTRLINNMLHGR
jgi:hypothetical protein